MITLVKVSVLTDDETLPADLKDKIVEALQGFVDDDPEGVAHAKITLEWAHAIHNRSYMKSLPTKMGADQIGPTKPKKVSKK